MSGKITKLDEEVIFKFCSTRNKKHALLVLIIIIDAILSVIVSYFYIIKDRILSENLKNCLDDETTSGITLLSQRCEGNEVVRNTVSLAFIYYLTFLTSIVGLALVDTKTVSLKLIQYTEVKLVYCIRAVSLFVYMDYTSERLEGSVFFYTSWISLENQLIMFGSSIALTVLVMVILGALKSFENRGIYHVLSSSWLVLIIVVNVTWYIPIANIHSRNVLSFIDIRGPGLQFITYVNFSIVILSLMEFLIINDIRNDTEVTLMESSGMPSVVNGLEMPLLNN